MMVKRYQSTFCSFLFAAYFLAFVQNHLSKPLSAHHERVITGQFWEIFKNVNVKYYNEDLEEQLENYNRWIMVRHKFFFNRKRLPSDKRHISLFFNLYLKLLFLCVFFASNECKWVVFLFVYFTLDAVYIVKADSIMILIRTTQSGHFAFIS